MIRVSFLTPSLHLGGAERFILTLASHFQRCIPHTLIQLPYKGGHFSHPMIERRARRLFRLERVRPQERLRDLVTRASEGADVLITWGCADLPDHVNSLDIPVVDVSHGDGEWPDQRELVARIHRCADMLVGVSNGALAAYNTVNYKKPTKVIPNGVDVEHVMPRFGAERHRSQIWEIPATSKVALFVGRFSEVKRPLLFIEAMARLPDQWIGVMLGHGRLQQEVIQAAASLPPGKILFPPLVPHIGDSMAASDCLVITSTHEGHPLGMNEAWLAGLPVVATPLAFTKDIYRECRILPCLTAAGEDLAGCVAEAIIASAHGHKGLQHPGHFADASQDAEVTYSVPAIQKLAFEQFTASAMAARWERVLLGLTQTTDMRSL